MRLLVGVRLVLYSLAVALFVVLLFIKLPEKRKATVTVPLEIKPRNYIEITQELRQERLREYCRTHNKIGATPRKQDFYHLLVHEEHKIIFCYIPKVGCTQWLKIMGKLEGLSDEIINPDPRLRRDSPEHDKIHTRKLFKFLDSYPADEAEKMLEEYTAFFFVREPLERLVSAYRDKFTQEYWPTAYYRQIARKIIKKMRPEATQKALREGLGVSFDEFTRFLVSTNTETWDHHWGLYDDICKPCKIKYKFIGHFENMEQEGPYLLEQASISHLVSADFRPSNTSSHLQQFYSLIPSETIFRIVLMSLSNFEMFGYPLPVPLKDIAVPNSCDFAGSYIDWLYCLLQF